MCEKLTPREEQVVRYMRRNCLGKKEVTKSRDLETALSMSATDFRDVVNRLRRKRIPIASSTQGYFYAETAGEVYGTIRNLKRMEQGLQAAIQGLEMSFDNFGGDADG